MSRKSDVLTTDSAHDVGDRVEATDFSPRKAGEPLGEEVMGLARNIFVSTIGQATRQICFCGVDPENGSSAVSASTARALVEIGATSVCLVDGNVRSPNLSRSFGVDIRNSFSESAGSVLEQCKLVDDKLWLAGTELMVDDRGLLLPPVKLEGLLKQLLDIFEFVVIDAPALSVCADAIIFGQIAGAAVLVVEANRTRRLTARRAKDTLEASGVRLLGTVLRNRSFPLPRKLFSRL